MSMYVVERNDGMGWIPKCHCTFEDTEQFIMIARNPYYRIMCDGKDVTAKYRNGKVASSTPHVESSSSSDTPVLKPAQYKAMSQQDKVSIQHSIKDCLQRKLKRTEIFKELNISEATYDTIRADMANTAASQNAADKPSKTIKQRSLI